MKTLFICKDRIKYGSAFGLINSARFIVDYLNSVGIESKIIKVEDHNKIDREVHLYKPTHVFLEALWVTPLKLLELINLYPKIVWSVRVHSDIPFLAMEGNAIDWITKYMESGAIVTVNKRNTLDELKYLKLDYLPNIYFPLNFKQPKFLGKRVLNIGCFGSIRPMKNHLQQAVAAIKFGDTYGYTIRFHINSDRMEQGGENVKKNLIALFNFSSHQLVCHPWLSRKDFLNMIKNEIDIGMQVSLSETFNIVAGDLTAMGIPTIGSNTIPWIYKVVTADFTVQSIVDKLNFISKNRHNANKVVQHNQSGLEESNVEAIKVWHKYLKKFNNPLI